MSEAIRIGMDNKIEKLIREDYVCRKNMFWETISFKNVKEITRDTAKFEKYPVLSSVDAWQGIILGINYFDDLDYLLKNYPVVAAGGAVFKAIYYMKQDSDVDIYFYGNYTAEKAEEYLVEIMCYFENKYKEPKKNIKFERNQGVTNIIVDYVKKYQFIHRVYPTKISIVGGFDLQCSSVYYDGNQYSTTPLGAWCIANRTNIFLHTRRSASYSHRMKKYYNKYSCSILLMNTTYEKLKHNYAITRYVDNFSISKMYGVYGLTSTLDTNDYESGYGAGTGTEKCTNAKYAVSDRSDLIMYGGETVNSIINPNIEYEINYRIIKCYTFAEVQSVSDAAPLLDYLFKYDKNTFGYKESAAKYWLQDKFEELRNKIYSYYMTDDDEDDKLEEIYNIYTNHILDKVKTGINTAKEKSKTLNWIVKNPMAQSYCVPTNPTTYFNQDIYTEFVITIPEPVETLLRLLTKHKVGPFSFLNRNTLNKIIQFYIFGL